ncbi:uncharacterized protein LOC124125500 [Haliotis rufescens]|uniref:uncharacterized protein LOC124125500 n=1 Tax=Haliotis rufescens TaxID=6454 RepID=UPI00201FAF4D|nr:uncharacterized protein LOC124125500 [Haliotis rufescens]
MMLQAVCVFLWCASVCSGQKSQWINITGNGSYSSNKNTAKSPWWLAVKACASSGGHLFVPQKSINELENLLEENKVYWVGGFQYSSLVWTEDRARYYTRVGYMSPSEAKDVVTVTKENNSVFTCHLACGDTFGLFGLKGDSCYCLGPLSKQLSLDIVKKTRATEIRCPGDYNELCGDDTTITVYKRGTPSVTVSLSGRCGYVEKGRGERRDYQSFYLDGNCETKRFSACKKPTDAAGLSDCSGNVCVDNVNKTWQEERGDCRLVKVTDSNTKNLRTAMKYSSYWIGLRRFTEWRWINGITVDRKFSGEDFARQCLAARRNGVTLFLDWRNCYERYPAVCQSVTESTKLPERMTTKTMTTNIPGTTPVSTSATDSVTPMADNLQPDTHVTDVGVAVSVVAVSAAFVIIVFITLKRKKMYCFKMNARCDRATGHTHSDTGPMSCNDVSPSSIHGPADGNYCIIDDVESLRLYHHIRGASGEGGEYDTTRQVQRVRRDDSTYNHIYTEHDLHAADTGEDQNNVLKLGRSPGQTNASAGVYHHVGPGVAGEGEDQYNVLKLGRSPGQTNASTGMYHHVGPGVAGEGEDQYNVLPRGRSPGQTNASTGVYHHVGPGGSFEGEDQYNVLPRGRSLGQTNASTGVYHHVGPGGSFEGEDQYNVLPRGRSLGQTNASTGVYHHVGPGVAGEGEDQYNVLPRGRSLRQTNASTGVYHHVGPGGSFEGEDQYNVLPRGRSLGQTNASTGVYHHVGPGGSFEGEDQYNVRAPAWKISGTD